MFKTYKLFLLLSLSTASACNITTKIYADRKELEKHKYERKQEFEERRKKKELLKIKKYINESTLKLDIKDNKLIAIESERKRVISKPVHRKQ